MQRSSGSGQGGFSLIELTVAMAVTMIVSGAIFGLLAGGQTAFRREPELADRQQNIRVAMDLILRDIANAGSGMPNFMQTFTQGLDACGTCPQGPDGLVTDQLEMVTNAAAMDNVAACSNPVGPPNNAGSHMLHLLPSVTTITPNTLVVLTMADGRWTVRNVVAVTVDPATLGPPSGGSYENCSTDVPAVATPHVLLDLGATGDTSGMNVDDNLCVPTPGGVGTVVNPCDVVEVGFAELVRYQIVLDPQGVPLLQRWTSANAAGPQTIARGIEELQVRYIQAGFDASVEANWQDNAPTVIPDAWNTLITQVRVTLSARSEAQNVQGATDAASGPDALRGRLASVGSPRSSLHALTRVPVPSPAPSVLPQLWR